MLVLLRYSSLLLRPGRGAEYFDQLVSVCLCVREHISGTAGPIFAEFCVHILCGCGSVLLWWRCDTLCTSGFMDNVTFGRNGQYGDVLTAEPQPTTASGVAIPGRSLMPMNALL